MKLIYLIYLWTNPRAGCEFIDCIYFHLYFQTPFINYLLLNLCSWLCKLHKICNLCMGLDSYFKQEAGLNKPLGLNFLERSSRTLAWFSSSFLLLFRQHRQCQSHSQQENWATFKMLQPNVDFQLHCHHLCLVCIYMCTVLQIWPLDMSKHHANVSEPGLKVITATQSSGWETSQIFALVQDRFCSLHGFLYCHSYFLLTHRDSSELAQVYSDKLLLLCLSWQHGQIPRSLMSPLQPTLITFADYKHS